MRKVVVDEKGGKFIQNNIEQKKNKKRTKIKL